MAASGLNAGGSNVHGYRASFARSDIVARVCDKLYTPLFEGLFGERFPTIRYQYEPMTARMTVHLKQMGSSGVAIEMTETYYGKKYEIHIKAEAPLNEKLVRSIVEEYPDIFRDLFYFSTGVHNDYRDGSVILEGAVLPPSAAALVERMTAPDTKVGFEEHIKALYAKAEVEYDREHKVEYNRGLEEAQREFVERQRKLLEAERVRLEREPVAAGGAGGGASASSPPAPAPAPSSPYEALKEALKVPLNGIVFSVGENVFSAAKGKYFVVNARNLDSEYGTFKIYLDDFSIENMITYKNTNPKITEALESVVSRFRPAAKDASRRSARKQRKSRRTNRKRGSRSRTH